jgi:hypothetical protein
MPAQTIGVIPEHGYNPHEKRSNKCVSWLKYLANSRKINIRHALNGNEFKVGQYKLDDYCEETKEMFEFHGCLFHGCLKCFTSETFNPLKRTTMGLNYQGHCQRIKWIKENKTDFKLVEIWECEWDKKIKNDFDLKDFLREHPLNEPLQVRDSLYGGRVDTIKMYHKCAEDEEIRYIDYTSLYPYIQKYGIFPIGHAEIITENFDYSLKNYFGLVKLTILPPLYYRRYQRIFSKRITGQ